MPISLNPQIDLDMGAGFVDRTGEFYSFDCKSKRAEVDSSRFGDFVDQIEKGTFSNELSAKLRPTSMGLLLELLTEMRKDTPTPIRWLRNADATKGIDNPELTFSAMVTDAPLPTGGKGDLIEKDVTWQIVTAITWDDGTNVIAIGG